MRKELASIVSERARALQAVGIEQAVNEVELVLCHLLKSDRLHLYLEGRERLNDSLLKRLDEIITQRATRYPLQYILGETWFYGRRFLVNPSVMVPTPETELLCELALDFAKEKRGRLPPNPRVLDLGVGAGVIAITVAAELEECSVLAVDRSPATLDVATRNAVDLEVGSRIEFRHSDFFTAVSPGERFALILSNPPYISTREYPTLPPEVKADPKIALLAGEDGLEAIRVILRDAPDHLEAGGRLMFEIGREQARAVSNLTAGDDRYRSLVIVKDLNDLDRVAILSCDA